MLFGYLPSEMAGDDVPVFGKQLMSYLSVLSTPGLIWGPGNYRTSNW